MTRDEFIIQSLELDLFFLRIMKEHAFFMEAAFPTKNRDLAITADYFKQQFEQLLTEALELSVGVIGSSRVATGQFVTPLTLEAERMSQFYTAIPLDMRITAAENQLASAPPRAPDTDLEEQVSRLNERAIVALTALMAFKQKVLDGLIGCEIFMNTYVLLIEHILREAGHFMYALRMLQRRAAPDANALAQEEIFWNTIMAEHSKFIRGLLDPTEVALFDEADRFGKQFDVLADAAKKAAGQPALLVRVTRESRSATEKVRDFNTAGTSGLLDCKIRAIILPLLGDHVLRESNHFLTLLGGA